MPCTPPPRTPPPRPPPSPARPPPSPAAARTPRTPGSRSRPRSIPASPPPSPLSCRPKWGCRTPERRTSIAKKRVHDAAKVRLEEVKRRRKCRAAALLLDDCGDEAGPTGKRRRDEGCDDEEEVRQRKAAAKKAASAAKGRLVALRSRVQRLRRSDDTDALAAAQQQLEEHQRVLDEAEELVRSLGRPAEAIDAAAVAAAVRKQIAAAEQQQQQQQQQVSARQLRTAAEAEVGASLHSERWRQVIREVAQEELSSADAALEEALQREVDAADASGDIRMLTPEDVRRNLSTLAEQTLGGQIRQRRLLDRECADGRVAVAAAEAASRQLLAGCGSEAVAREQIREAEAARRRTATAHLSLLLRCAALEAVEAGERAAIEAVLADRVEATTRAYRAKLAATATLSLECKTEHRCRTAIQNEERLLRLQLYCSAGASEIAVEEAWQRGALTVEPDCDESESCSEAANFADVLARVNSKYEQIQFGMNGRPFAPQTDESAREHLLPLLEYTATLQNDWYLLWAKVSQGLGDLRHEAAVAAKRAAEQLRRKEEQLKRSVADGKALLSEKTALQTQVRDAQAQLERLRAEGRRRDVQEKTVKEKLERQLKVARQENADLRRQADGKRARK
eukprot:TRINITY_DN841_c0_g1_i1.p1 TRINITY_DN841_c0_g1~~TRINITY_DN841_c0_g1_i1.p1  ORF type:complete len:646 (+),score=218.47 TRINITY_DN841_c0_g1_i1:68-1939(+)